MEATLTRVHELLPAVAARTEEIERARRLPPDLVDALAHAGCCRMFVPAAYGGDELKLPEALRVIEALGSADGSTGWAVAQVCLAQFIFASFPEETVDELYTGGPDLYGAGAVAPKGRASREDDGWRVSGQWPFVTGCKQASWIYLNCVVLEGHGLKLMSNRMPETRMMLFAADEVEILDTWHAVGLRGTSSHDVRVERQFCPGVRSYDLSGDRAAASRTIFGIARVGLLIAAVAVGIAQGALNEVAELAADGKRPTFSLRRLAESPLFQDQLGQAHMVLRAARALLYSEAEAASERVATGETRQPFDRAVLRATAAQVVALATRAVDTAHALAGGSAVYESSPLQRRLRDIHTATQHFVVGRDFYGVVGALLAGAEIDTTLL